LDWHVQLARETISFWSKGFSEETSKKLENFGFIQLRPGGELSILICVGSTKAGILHNCGLRVVLDSESFLII